MLRLFSKDLLRYFPAQAVPALLSIIAIPLFTRILSTEQFGQYALIMSSVAIMVALQGWLTMAIIRFYPAVCEQEVAVLVRTAFWAQLVSVFLLSSLVFILTSLFLETDIMFQRLINAALVLFILQSIFYLLTHVLRARLKASAYSFFMVWTKFTGLGLGIFLTVHLQLGPVGILYGVVFGIITVLPFLWQQAFAGVQVVGPVSTTLLRELALYGIPLVVGNLGAWVLSQSDRYLIQIFYGTREVGLYSSAYWISENSIRLLGMLFMLASGPLLASVWEKQGQEASKHLFATVTRLYLIMGVPAVVGMVALAEPLMQVLTGPEFSSGYTIVPWVASGAFFLGLQHRFNQVLLLLKRSQIIMFWLIVSSALNIALNWWTLPVFGYEIAAINTLTCYVFLSIALALASRRYFRWHFPWLTAVRSLLAASVMFGAVYFLVRTNHLSPVWTLCLAIPGGAFIYGLSIWIFGEISPAEWKTLEAGGRQWISIA